MILFVECSITSPSLFNAIQGNFIRVTVHVSDLPLRELSDASLNQPSAALPPHSAERLRLSGDSILF
jgi:hypothetical protein